MAPADGASRRRFLRPVLLRLAFYGAAVFLALPAAFCRIITTTIRQPTGPPPAGYEQIELMSDRLRLRAWLAPGDPAKPAAVIVHGLGDTLESYVAIADILRRRGHTVLLPDLRAHGGSEGNTVTLGAKESGDVQRAMAALRERGLAGSGFVLMGSSLGAVSVLCAAPREPDVRAVIVEAPFDSMRNTVAHHAWLLYRIPSWTGLPALSIFFAERWASMDADDADAVGAASRLEAPLFALVDGDDPRMPEAVVRRIVDAHSGPHELWVVPGAPHAGALLHPDYERRLLAFLDTAF